MEQWVGASRIIGCQSNSDADRSRTKECPKQKHVVVLGAVRRHHRQLQATATQVPGMTHQCAARMNSSCERKYKFGMRTSLRAK